MRKIRVVIADDSSLVRGMLRSFIEAENDIEVVGEAMNGYQAIELARDLKPDVITMDLEMPLMSGLEAIEKIMYSKAVPILVVSSEADAHRALDAVNLGALDVVGKPDANQAAEFIAKLRLLSGVSVITRLRPRISHAPVLSPVPPVPGLQPGFYRRVIAIASSTGGPQALAHILGQLPADFASPVLIAQHISDDFAKGMAEWLSGLCKLPVRLACEGEVIAAGVIYISPSERHLTVTHGRQLRLQKRGENDLYRPSCDLLLKSVADVFGRHAIGIILTGMGHDGVEGLAAIRQVGGVTLGQDEASSVIYGMNRVAIERGEVHRVLPLDSIASAMVSLILPAGI